jgi:hypothetical protein
LWFPSRVDSQAFWLALRIPNNFGQSELSAHCPAGGQRRWYDMGIEGLWAARWSADVDSYSQASVSNTLFFMACTLTGGAWLLGSVGRWLVKRGVGIETVFVGAALLCMVTQALILLRVPLLAPIFWGIVSMFASITVLIFAVMSEFFPNEKIGRANALLAVGFRGGGFVIQLSVGYVLALWRAGADGNYPVQPYEIALAVPLAVQSLSFAWFLWYRAGARLAAPLLQS